MTRELADAEVELTRPAASSPYAVLGADAVLSVELDERAEVGRDPATVELFDDGGEIATGDERIRSGDRIDVSIRRASEPGSGDGISHEFTGMVRDLEIESVGPGLGFIVRLDPAADFVFSALSFRNVFASFESEPIDGIIKTIVDQEVPEIGTDLDDFGDTETDVFADGTRADDVVRRLVDEEDAFVASKGTDLVVRRQDTLPEPLTLSGDEHGPPRVRRPDDELANRIRVDGATGSAVDEQQETVDTFETVNESTRETTILDTRKAQLAAIQVATDRVEDGGDLRVRVQKAEAGAPVDPDDRRSDVVSESLSSEFVATDGDFTRVVLAEHTLPETSVAVMVEGGDGEQRVGTDADGNIAFRSEFEFPLAARESDADSVQRHRRRDKRIRKRNIDSTAAARGEAVAELRGRTTPRLEVTVSAESDRAQKVEPLDTIRLVDESVPSVARDRDLVVVERRVTLADRLERVQLTAADPEQF